MIRANHFRFSRGIAVFSFLLSSVVIFLGPIPLAAEEAAAESEPLNPFISNMQFSGYVENESAVRLHVPHKFSKFQNLLQLELDGDISTWGNVKVLTWALYDAVYNYYLGDYPDEVEDEYGSNFTADEATDQILREFYMDFFLDAMDIRLGKQQVVWGEAIGLRITDIVNPMDYREFILDDFIDSRIPLWVAKATYYFGDFDLTGIWIPFFEPDKPALEKSDWMWTFNRITPPSGTSLDMDDADEPDMDIENSEYGFRLAGLIGDWNMSLMHLYAWDDVPARHVQFNSREFSLDVDQRFHRLPMTGFTLANAFGSFVPRGEFAYYQGKFFSTADEKADESLVQKDFIHYMIGTDYTYSDHLINIQLIQKIIIDYEDDIYEDVVQNSVSFWWQGNYLNETLKPELLAIYDTNEGAWLIRPKTGYEVTDWVTVTLGCDVFSGPSRSFFGQFNDNDRLYIEVKYSF